MEGNKLYNALLKTQAKHDRKASDRSASGSVIQSEPQLREPNWTVNSSGGDETRPAQYDSAASLAQINNPNPWTRDDLKARKIIYPGMPQKAILDAYREIRIQLRDKSGESNFSVMVSSLSRKDSSVLSAFNLAATFALDASTSALLVDCNPYDQHLNRLVSTPLGKGITDYVAHDDMSVKDIIYPSGIDRLSVVPAGHLSTSAVELFSASRMKTLMNELRGRYPDRYIVIHAPSFRFSTEARILVRYADHALLTIPFGEITPEEVVSAVDALGTDKFSGLVYQE